MVNPKFHYYVIDENGDKFMRFNFHNDAKRFISIRPEFKVQREIRSDWVDINNFEPCLL